MIIGRGSMRQITSIKDDDRRETVEKSRLHQPPCEITFRYGSIIAMSISCVEPKIFKLLRLLVSVSAFCDALLTGVSSRESET
uniref:Uncharacterized protein n=1 Tax=Romanomermis culicivorax TaxID=13658 RepID=A0A915IHT3_ROMCU